MQIIEKPGCVLLMKNRAVILMLSLIHIFSENGENIREQLRTRKYKPQPVRRVEIPKPDGGIRNLGVPTVADRFVQQAVAQDVYKRQYIHNVQIPDSGAWRYPIPAVGRN